MLSARQQSGMVVGLPCHFPIAEGFPHIAVNFDGLASPAWVDFRHVQPIVMLECDQFVFVAIEESHNRTLTIEGYLTASTGVWNSEV